MKSLIYTLLAAVAVAYLGSFLGLWVMPHQEDPYTYLDLWEKVQPRLPQVEVPRPDNFDQD